MKKNLLLTIILTFAIVTGYSQSIWNKTSDGRVASLAKLDRSSMPKDYQVYHLNLNALKTQLENAPSRTANGVSNSVISFPNAKGELERFRVYEASVLEAPLAVNHPEIQSYVGQGIDDPTASIYFSTTIYGLHTVTRTLEGTSYIDPYTADLQNYIVYDRASRAQEARHFGCQVDDNEMSGRGASDFSNVPFAND